MGTEKSRGLVLSTFFIQSNFRILDVYLCSLKSIVHKSSICDRFSCFLWLLIWRWAAFSGHDLSFRRSTLTTLEILYLLSWYMHTVGEWAVSPRTSSPVLYFPGESGQAAESFCSEVGVHFYASRSTSKVSPCESFGKFVHVVAFCPERCYS